MKFNFDGLEIEIKAKKTNKARANKDDTGYIMNLISIYAHEASERYNELKMHGFSKNASELSEILYKTLEENEYYK